MSWKCNCGLINGGTNKHCAGIQLSQYSHYQVSVNEPDWIMAVIAAKEVGLMTPEEELYAKFYNHERICVQDMDHIELQTHIEELQKIAFEAKARVQSATDKRREDNAKISKKEWLVSDDRPDVNVSDAINVVKKRQERMSKMDKIQKQLRDAGIDEDVIKEMIRNLSARATDAKLKTVVFKVPATELKAVQIKTDETANGEPKQPFNASDLKFD